MSISQLPERHRLIRFGAQVTDKQLGDSISSQDERGSNVGVISLRVKLVGNNTIGDSEEAMTR